MQELIAKTKAIIKQEEENYIQSPSHGLYLSIRLNQYYLTLFESMLEKEKEVMCQFQSDGQWKDFYVKYEDNEDCFDKTFNTKER